MSSRPSLVGAVREDRNFLICVPTVTGAYAAALPVGVVCPLRCFLSCRGACAGVCGPQLHAIATPHPRHTGHREL